MENTQTFDLRSLLSFNPEGGIIKFMGHRVLLFDAVAMGLLRRELFDRLGVSAARNVLTRLGYAHGWLAADHLSAEWPDLLGDPRFGPALHMLQGLVSISEFNFNVGNELHHTTCTWHDSYEAEQHVLQFGISTEPVCWTLTGFISGYTSRTLGRELYCIEHKCVGKGDAYCSVEARLIEDWGPEIHDHLPFFREKTIDGILEDVTAKLRKAERRLIQLKKTLDTDIYSSGIIANSSVMRDTLSLAKRAAKVDSFVMLTGETGSGKELIARLIHDESARSSRPFVSASCSAVSPSLLESEFFGHARGAFPGADRDRAGLFEGPRGGTVFIEKIEEMPFEMQAKLLRVIQEGSVCRVGEAISRPVDFRIIAASNRDLEEDVKSGRFRSDLYYRLCVIGLTMPPLRQRVEDILPLARFFLAMMNKGSGRGVKGFSPAAVECLLRHDWPGNVRELQNVVERAVALCAGTRVELEDLPHGLRKPSFRPVVHDDIRPLREIERKYVLAVFELAKGDKKLAATKLDIGLRTLYRKLEEYGVR